MESKIGKRQGAGLEVDLKEREQTGEYDEEGGFRFWYLHPHFIRPNQPGIAGAQGFDNDDYDSLAQILKRNFGFQMLKTNEESSRICFPNMTQTLTRSSRQHFFYFSFK